MKSFVIAGKAKTVFRLIDVMAQVEKEKPKKVVKRKPSLKW